MSSRRIKAKLKREAVMREYEQFQKEQEGSVQWLTEVQGKLINHVNTLGDKSNDMMTGIEAVFARIDERLTSLELASMPVTHAGTFAAKLQELLTRIVFATVNGEPLTTTLATDEYVRKHVQFWLLDVRDMVDKILYGDLFFETNKQEISNHQDVKKHTYNQPHKPTKEFPLHEGVRKLYSFANGYGASVVRHKYSYGWEKMLWELGVTTADDGELCYDTPITSDVIGHLTDEEVEKLLDEIEALPARVSQ